MPASSSASVIRFLKEATPGVEAGTPPQTYRVTGGTLSQSTESSEDNELRNDRGRGDSTLVSGSVGGNLEVNYSHKTHTEFLEALLANAATELGTDGLATACSDAVFTQSTHTISSATTGLPVVAPYQWFSITSATDAANVGIFRASGATHDGDSIVVDTEVLDVTDAASGSAILSGTRITQAYDALESFTIERELTDLTIPKFFTWLECYVSSLSLNYAIGDKLSGSFGFLGATTETQTTTSGFASVGSAVAATTTPYFNTVTGTSVLLDEVTMGESCVESLTMDIQANLRERRCIGSGLAASSIGLDPFKISFTANIYFGTAESAALYAKKIADTALSFSVCLSDSSGNGFAISMPRCKITSAEVDAGGMGSDVMMSLAADAVTDSTDDTMIHIDILGSTA